MQFMEFIAEAFWAMDVVHDQLATGKKLRVLTVVDTFSGRCCRNQIVEDSYRESMRLERVYEQAITRPLPHDELVQLHGFAVQARVSADLAGQGHDLACAA